MIVVSLFLRLQVMIAMLGAITSTTNNPTHMIVDEITCAAKDCW